MERGEQNVTIDVLIRFTKALGCTLGELARELDATQAKHQIAYDEKFRRNFWAYMKSVPRFYVRSDSCTHTRSAPGTK